MKRTIFVIISLLSFAAVSCEKNSADDVNTGGESSLTYDTAPVAGRDAVVVKPEDIDADAPVVVLLSDDTTLRSLSSRTPDINFKAAEHCLIGRYVLCVIAAGENADVSFLSSVRESFPGASKLYLLSYRNGLSYTAAMLMPDEFAAFGCVSGAIDVEAYRANGFRKPVPFVHVHATDNSVYKWNGVEDRYVSVPLSVGAIVAADRCITFETSDLLPRDGKGRVSCTHYIDGESGCDVKLYCVESGDNGWCDEEFEVYNQIWNFFKTH